MRRKFDNEEFNDLYFLPNSLINGCDIEHKNVRTKVQNNFISEKYKRTERLRDSGINVRIILK